MGAELVIPGITRPDVLICVARARTFRPYCILVRDALAGRCSFCDLDTEVNKVVAEGTHWRAWENPGPEKHTRHHFIVAPRRHVVDSMELSVEEEIGWWSIYRVLRLQYKLNSCGILMRDVAPLLAGTIEHLHIHLMCPDGTGRVESPFYQGAEAESKSLARAVVFEKLRQELERLSRENADGLVPPLEIVVAQMRLTPREHMLVWGRLS